MNKLIFRIICLVAFVLHICPASSQPGTKKEKKQVVVEVSSFIVDEKGDPVKGVAVIGGSDAKIVYSDHKGRFVALLPKNSTVVFEAYGYKEKFLELSNDNEIPQKIVLEKDALFTTNKSLVSRNDGGYTHKSLEVGATSSLSRQELGGYSDIIMTNGLQGKLMGLQISNTVNGLGNNNPEIYVRGLHAMSNNTAMVIVDGVERGLDNLIPEEIESIELMKDATTKIIYGPRAANGVLYVKTRRGHANQREYNVTAEIGITQMTRTPRFLDSYNYAALYNEARGNDGLSPFYTNEQLKGYYSSKGVNDLLYPNVDYYDEFLNNNASYRKIAFDMAGGTNRVRYALVVGYNGGTGFEKSNYTPVLNKFNLRGNLDFKVTDFVTVRADVAARIELRKLGQKNSSQVFSDLTSHRPNEYPLVITPDAMYPDMPRKYDDTTPAFGTSLAKSGNLYSDMMYGGYRDERYSSGQMNLGLDFNLGMVTKGLTAGAYVSFDNYDYLQVSLSKIYPTYAINPYINSIGVADTLYTQMKKPNVQTDQQRTSTSLQQLLGWNAFVAYDHTIGEHAIGARLAYMYSRISNQGVTQDYINVNNTLRLNYSYKNKYIIENDYALMGSNRFTSGNRYFLSSALGAAWVISNESFLKGSESINFLKLKASGGVLGFDRSTPYLLGRTSWIADGSFKFGPTNTGADANILTYVRTRNPGLKWEKSLEYNWGLEGVFFKNRLYVELNYFIEQRKNIIGDMAASYGGYVGDFSYQGNMGEVHNKGVEMTVNWKDRIDDFSYSVGINGVYTKNKVVKWNEVQHGEAYRYTVGKSTDDMRGLVAEGLFGKDVSLDDHIYQTFSDYQHGDIAYKNLNGDNVIDGRDVQSVGNSYPRMTFGLDLSLAYRGWQLDMLGYSEIGKHTWATNTYYWNRGEGKYSILALDRYHPKNNPGGTYPRLTTTAGDNNFRNSTFWLLNTSFFRMKNMELSYTFSSLKFAASLNKVKLFVRGNNLFVISSVKGLDPELLNSGIGNYPVTRNITFGTSFVF